MYALVLLIPELNRDREMKEATLRPAGWGSVVIEHENTVQGVLLRTTYMMPRNKPD